MATTYSLYEAKARLSALVRQVREGRSVIITLHGKPVAELRPVQDSARTQTLDERVEELERRGELATSPEPKARVRQGKPKRGALRRFLAERE